MLLTLTLIDFVISEYNPTSPKVLFARQAI
jgi:hypothetical protein